MSMQNPDEGIRMWVPGTEPGSCYTEQPPQPSASTFNPNVIKSNI